MPRKLIKDMTPEEHERIKAYDRQLWHKHKERWNRKRRTGKNYLYTSQEIMKDKNGNPIKGGHNNVIEARGRQKWERFTIEYVEDLLQRMIEWYNDNPDEPFVYQYFMVDDYGKQQPFYRNMMQYLSERSSNASFLIERLRTAEEIRLLKLGIQKKANAGMIEFFLINKSGYHSKNQNVTNNNTLEIKEGGRIQLLPPSDSLSGELNVDKEIEDVDFEESYEDSHEINDDDPQATVDKGGSDPNKINKQNDDDLNDLEVQE